MITHAAAALRLAESTRAPVAQLSASYPELTVADAYRIQAENIQRRERAGAVPVGHKIGLTSVAMQEQMNVAEPDSGILLDDMIIADGASLAIERLIVPRIEAELGFWLGTDLAGPEVSVADAEAAIASVCLALEIIDSRFKDWRISLVDTVADNASSAFAVPGRTIAFSSALDRKGELVTLRVNGSVAAVGPGSAVLGDPIEAVAWLARRLSATGDSLRAGQLIMTGAVHASVVLEPGTDIEASSPGLPPVRLYAV